MINQALALGETEDALMMRLSQLARPETTSENERRLYFMRGILPKGWTAEAIEFVETVVPEFEDYVNDHIDLSPYAPIPEITSVFQHALAAGYEKTHQGLQHPEHGQLDLSVPTDPTPYVEEARRQLAEQGYPTRRIFEKDGQHFLMWELMRSPDKEPDEPLVTEIILLLPACVGELQLTTLKPRRLPPTVETFAYHQIFIMLERVYAEWPKQDELLQEIALNVLTLRELEALNLPRAFALAHAI